jgi:hypothetical protein
MISISKLFTYNNVYIIVGNFNCQEKFFNLPGLYFPHQIWFNVQTAATRHGTRDLYVRMPKDNIGTLRKPSGDR